MSTGLHQKLAFIENGRLTRRFHGLPVHHTQRVDSHLYGQAVLVRLIIGDDAPAERRLRLMEACLFDGDIAEWITGDMPAPMKRAMPDYTDSTFREVMGAYEDRVMAEATFEPVSLCPADKRVLKLADAVEGCLHTINERYMGNAHPRTIYCFHEFWKYAVVDQTLGCGPEAGEDELLRYVGAEWTKANGGVW